MKTNLCRNILVVAVAAVVPVIVACGSADGPVASSNPTSTSVANASNPEVQATAEPTISSLQATDTPVPGSTDGTFSVGSGSEATFTVNEKLSSLPLPNDAVLRTSDITGEIDLGAGNASLIIDLHSLRSDQSRRDNYVRSQLIPRQPQATITVHTFPAIPETFAEGRSFTATVIGTVNVNGADAEIEFEIEARFDPDRLLVLVKGDFTWADFGMTAPTSCSFSVRDEVHVEVLISAEPV
ncbi:MAG: YceI family protein [Chloroflexi bacterium]|nr:YceI family protein [Chloroflexota bacterium]